ncbi:MAG TPA: A/G-specific adenine glycosylase [Burkholderiales bacterium]|nr:A/G-specific adenine glycosylase [Burkholderiales bacterium]
MNAGAVGPSFAARLIAWQKTQGRHELPWQSTRDPYRIWLSEIMLQQTQVAAVVPYYERFLARLPDLAALAAAQEDAVLALWAGLGYYARARNLHRAAQTIVQRHRGIFPRELDAVRALPGVGRSTAAAICAFAYGTRAAILDGNVKRVLTRHFGIDGYPGERRIENALWRLSESLLPARDVEAYTQGLMDLGATLCVRGNPRCGACPLQDGCVARREGRTQDWPTVRPAKALPQRRTTMLVLVSRGELLLEKRPASGIWGGLWCFPEIDGARFDREAGLDWESGLERECLARFGLHAGASRRLRDIEHGFTHFRLRITPVLVRTDRAPGAGEPGSLWLTPADARGAAIPAPVRKIIDLIEVNRDS